MIVKTPDTCSGSARIDGTRMTVWFLVAYMNDDEAILSSYPHLSQAQLDEAWTYYRDNKAEIDTEIKQAGYGDFSNRNFSFPAQDNHGAKNE